MFDDLHCVLLDGTDAVTCNYQGPYKLVPKRGMPTMAKMARNDRIPFLQCVPALEGYQKKVGIQNSLTERLTSRIQNDIYEEVVEGQNKCNKFKERG